MLPLEKWEGASMEYNETGNNKKHEQVYEYLLKFIDQHHLHPDDKLPTEMEISQALHVSRTTVQRALRELVQNKIAYRIQGGGTYLANPAPASQQNITFIPLIVSNQQKSTGCYDYIAGAESFLSKRGCYLTIHNTGADYSVEKTVINNLVNDGARYILLLPSEDADPGFYYQHMRRGVHFIFLDRRPFGLSCDMVGSNNILGGFLACEHLIRLGHRRIAYIGGAVASVNTLRDRYEGFCAAMRVNNLPLAEDYGLVHVDELRLKAVIKETFSHPDPPTAFFASSDSLAAATILALRELGLETPRDISVVGFDGTEVAAVFSPSITTIEQPFFDIGVQAAELAFQRMNSPESSPSYIQKNLAVRLSVRDSSKPFIPPFSPK